jgi:hypothetical protein
MPYKNFMQVPVESAQMGAGASIIFKAFRGKDSSPKPNTAEPPCVTLPKRIQTGEGVFCFKGSKET